MKILGVIHNYYPKMGGAELIAHTNMQGFTTLGHDVKMLTSQLPGTDEREVINKEEIIRFKSFHILNNRVSLPSLDMFQKLYHAFFVYKPDQVHIITRYSFVGFLAFVMAKITKTRIIHEEYLAGRVTGEGFLINTATLIWDRVFSALMIKGADKIVALSQSVKTFIVDDFGVDPDKIAVISSGCRFLPAKKNFEQKFKSKPEVFNILWAARMVPLKDPLKAVEAVHKLIEKGLSVSLSFAGEGPLFSELEDYIKNHNLEEHVFLLGKLNAENLEKALDKSHIFLSTSKLEGLCLSVLEAIYRTNFVISTKTAGPDELLCDSPEFLLGLENFDADILADKITWLVENYTSLIVSADENRNRVLETYTNQSSLEKYQKYILA